MIVSVGRYVGVAIANQSCMSKIEKAEHDAVNGACSHD